MIIITRLRRVLMRILPLVLAEILENRLETHKFFIIVMIIFIKV